MRRRKGAGASSFPVSLTIVSSCLIVSLCAASRFILAARVAIDINVCTVSLRVRKGHAALQWHGSRSQVHLFLSARKTLI
ncbi:hypothetical protein BCAR13_370038 [Paraburkholderia caribensis]|nr:hypothetical protein BCAR13_370038 [Paraburkholderia caribensis]